MGAIAAYLSGSRPPDPRVIDRMLGAAPHRGDRRLTRTIGRCVVGVSFSDDMPEAASVATLDGTTAVVCGVIDNLAEVAPAVPRGDVSPAALLLEAFRTYGDDAPNRLRGVFAGILTDGTRVRMFRDHIGLEPLFYRDEGADLYVATEAKQILAGAGIPREPERTVVAGMLFDNYSDETLTALRGVRRVPPGTVMSATPDGVHRSRYWEPYRLLETLRLSDGDVRERFDALMAQATHRALTGRDVLTLSGGIDSPTVAAYAATAHRERFGRALAALSSVYPRFPSVDERPFIELLARRFSLDLHLYEPKSTPFDGMRAIIRLCDSPAPSTSLAQTREEHLIARSLGFRTILTGEFAEYLIDVGQAHLVTHLVHARRFAALRALLAEQRARGVSLRRIGRQLARAIVPGAVIDAYDQRRDDRKYRPDWLDARMFIERGPERVPPSQRWRQWQLGVFDLPSWSFEADAINQAASGVRVRRPWIDIDLWEFFLGLPAETKYPDVEPKKLFARRLMRGRVPDEILDRRQKTYFDDWLMAMIDYPFLRELFSDPSEQVAGVDYKRLSEHLEREDLTVRDFLYIRDLTAIHAFLEG